MREGVCVWGGERERERTTTPPEISYSDGDMRLALFSCHVLSIEKY